ncbi:thiol-disulfide oxidoreductase DCC family protein [Halorarius litoreus]|uniref:thiol-disulfide oxidoreductase DCC family protein n=1 Tax=Halorarius litoreus TaxID=2962676 RepID=UPI0020CEF9DD|nr:DCC1-like thiol-disulfide oxidoreductase family protein [Halorarius litoreus]
MDDGRPVVLFDGVCNVCSWSVQFIHEHDDGQVMFAPLQSAAGSELLREHRFSEDYFDSLVYVDETGAYAKSDGAVRIARHLDAPYRWAWHARFVPKVVRDAAYDAFAAIRYRVFGKKDECMMPTDELRSRFLAQSA